MIVRVPASSANLGPGFDTLGLALGLHLELGFEAPGADAVASRPTRPEPIGIGRRSSSTSMVSAFAANVSARGASLSRLVTATACAGDSDDPSPSMIATTLGRSSSNAAFTSPPRVLPPDPSRRSEPVSQRSGSSRNAATSGRAPASPTSRPIRRG